MPQIPDDQTAAFLAGMAENPGPKLYELPPAGAREALKGAMKMFEIPPCEMGYVEDHDITYDGGSYKVRLYSPPGAGEKMLPATILYHGGGFILGDIETHDSKARYLCFHTGHRVISVDYRLAPEHVFPAGLEDCYHALLWVAEKAVELGIDRGNISLIGDSAGGNLAAGVTQLAMQRAGPEIASVVMLYPSCDARIDADYPSRGLYGNGDYFLGIKDVEWIAENYANGEDPVNNTLLSPIRNKEFDGWPPTLVLTAGMDILRDEGRAFYDLLMANSVKARYLTYDGTIHGFVSFAAVLDQGKTCLSDIVQYLNEGKR